MATNQTEFPFHQASQAKRFPRHDGLNATWNVPLIKLPTVDECHRIDLGAS